MNVITHTIKRCMIRIMPDCFFFKRTCACQPVLYIFKADLMILHQLKFIHKYIWYTPRYTCPRPRGMFSKRLCKRYISALKWKINTYFCFLVYESMFTQWLLHGNITVTDTTIHPPADGRHFVWVDNNHGVIKLSCLQSNLKYHG